MNTYLLDSFYSFGKNFSFIQAESYTNAVIEIFLCVLCNNKKKVLCTGMLY